MWIETDHHGLVNLQYIKRVDLAGDIEKNSFGVYLFDAAGNTYPIIDISRFTHIGILKGTEKENDIRMAVYCFYTVLKRLISSAAGVEVVSIETIYKDFATEWYSQRTMENTDKKEKVRKSKPDKRSNVSELSVLVPQGIHYITNDKKID
jgi:hypothetical protein